MRFVVLRHECPADYDRPSHWDFMIEKGDVLQTWALLESPDSPMLQPAEALADHRASYLTYEGPLSDDRGHVMRWDEGTFEPCEVPESGADASISPGAERSIKLTLRGRRLVGIAKLMRDAEGWHYDFIPSINRS